MDLTFLDKIEMEDLEGKDEKIQPIRFNKDEFYMLKFINFKNKRFATYIKELIEKDIKEYLNNTDITNSVLSIDLEQLKEELKEEIKEELIEEIRENLLKEFKEDLKEKLDNMDLKQENIDESKSDLLNFMNNRK